MPYINYNGNIYPEHEKLLLATNRGFKYGDGFFESMVMFNKKVPLIDYHFSRIEFTAQVLSATLPSRFNIEAFENMLLDLASVNDATNNARIRAQFYRKGKGLYLPDEDELGYVVTMDKIENTKFEAGDGIIAGLREDCYKSISMVSDLKNSSALIYVLAAQFAKSEGWDECILTNHYGQVSESLYSNIFIVKNCKITTPNLDSGCVNGVMRTCLLGALEDEIQEKEIEVSELLEADEILLTNAVKGVRWVKQIGSKSYSNPTAFQLTALLNNSLLDIS